VVQISTADGRHRERERERERERDTHTHTHTHTNRETARTYSGCSRVVSGRGTLLHDPTDGLCHGVSGGPQDPRCYHLRAHRLLKQTGLVPRPRSSHSRRPPRHRCLPHVPSPTQQNQTNKNTDKHAQGHRPRLAHTKHTRVQMDERIEFE
jgi:hypothetical protein